MLITICAALTAFIAGMCIGQYKLVRTTLMLSPERIDKEQAMRVKKLRSSAVTTSIIALVINVYNFFLIFG